MLVGGNVGILGFSAIWISPIMTGRSPWKRVKMWEYCHAGMSAPPVFSSGDARGLVGTSIVCNVFRWNIDALEFWSICGLGLFSNDTSSSQKNDISMDHQSVTTTSQWDPQLMALLGEVASTCCSGYVPKKKIWQLTSSQSADCKLAFPSCSQLSIKLMFQIYINCSVKWRNKSTDYCYSCSCVEVRVFGTCCIQINRMFPVMFPGSFLKNFLFLKKKKPRSMPCLKKPTRCHRKIPINVAICRQVPLWMHRTVDPRE